MSPAQQAVSASQSPGRARRVPSRRARRRRARAQCRAQRACRAGQRGVLVDRHSRIVREEAVHRRSVPHRIHRCLCGTDADRAKHPLTPASGSASPICRRAKRHARPDALAVGVVTTFQVLGFVGTNPMNECWVPAVSPRGATKPPSRREHPATTQEAEHRLRRGRADAWVTLLMIKAREARSVCVAGPSRRDRVRRGLTGIEGPRSTPPGASFDSGWRVHERLEAEGRLAR